MGQISGSALHAHGSNVTSQCHCSGWRVLCHRVCDRHSCTSPLQGCKHWTTQRPEACHLNTRAVSSQSQENHCLGRPSQWKLVSPQHLPPKPGQLRRARTCSVTHSPPQLHTGVGIFVIIDVKAKKTLGSAFRSLLHMQSWQLETLSCYLQTKQIWTRCHIGTTKVAAFLDISLSVTIL